MKKQITSIVSTALIGTILVSCGGGGNSTSETTASDATTSPAEETTSRFVADELPELDFKGEEVTWFIGDYQDAYWDDVYAEEANGSRVNDAIYGARRSVEERLNVTFDYFRKQVVYGDRNDIKATLMTSILAGDGAYDVYMGRTLIDMAIEDTNSLLNLADNKYIDLEKPWWNQSMLSLMPGDTVYEAAGDGTLSLIKHTFATFFNQDKLNDLGVTEDMYELVESGKWTVDKLAELAKLGYRDVNGNTVSDFGDEFGLTFGDSNKFIGFFYSFDFDTVEVGKNGFEINLASERNADAMDAAYNLVYNTVGVLMPGGNYADNTLAVMAFGGNYADKTFMQGNAAFTMSLVGDAGVILGDTKFEYGILPYPKLDESQESYKTAAQRYALCAIPCYSDADLAGAVLEAWSSECYRTVQPEYFETTLKTRYAYDSEMSVMFDLIKSTIYIGPSQYFSSASGADPGDYVKGNITGRKDGQWASTVAASLAKLEDGFEKVWETLK